MAYGSRSDKTPRTPVTQLTAKRNAHLQITFRTMEDAKYD